MGKILGIIYYIAAIYFALEILKSSKDTLKKVIWIVVLLIPLGAVIYYFLGRK